MKVWSVASLSIELESRTIGRSAKSLLFASMAAFLVAALGLLLVTHNQHEALAMADVIGVMRQGALEQWDTADHLYHRPKSQYVADFVGAVVLLQGQLTSANAVHTHLGTLKGRFSNACAERLRGQRVDPSG
ncbi:MAG: hypothetical protein KFF68_02265 [Desulfosarcina sp.]|nr:hypothetical protein [Desulfosarcina sp.]